ncbi:MAG: hypothetical protein IKG21_10370 [Atopobiaceae bacterium]|nr:hypothetical protein [Atopobiaceae bacterium]
MSKGRAILMVVEGEKAEPELMERALEVYGISDVDEICTCLWFVVDYGPQRLTRYLSTYAS